jgi:nuclear transport factor 2 (NTF2) superfamily protein
VQGLSLPLVIRLLDLEDDGSAAKEETKARIYAARAAVERLDELVAEDWVREDTAERMRGLYRFRENRFAARFDDGDDGSIEQRSQDYQRLRRELLDAERRAVVELRRQGKINDDIMNLVQRDLDLEDARLDV